MKINDNKVVNNFDYSGNLEDEGLLEKTEYIELANQKSAYFNQGNFTQVLEVSKFPENVAEVDMDHFAICSSKDFCCVGTAALGPCFAVCYRAKNKDVELFLGVAHMSILGIPDETFDLIMNKLIDNGCLKKSIEFYVIGGTEECFSQEIDFLKSTDAYPIKEVLFNLISVEEADKDEYQGLAVVISADEIFYSANCEFPSNQYLEEIQECLLNE